MSLNQPEALETYQLKRHKFKKEENTKKIGDIEEENKETTLERGIRT